jgi:hypothetical protein
MKCKNNYCSNYSYLNIYMLCSTALYLTVQEYAICADSLQLSLYELVAHFAITLYALVP